jgi:hypothetical protein
MPMFLMQLHAGMLTGDFEQAVPKAEGWKFYARCNDDDPLTCEFLFDDPVQFSVDRVRSDFIALLKYLFEAGKAGQPWRTIFKDGNLFHPVHTVTVQRRDAKGKSYNKTVEVLQFKKKRTDIRVLSLQTGVGTCNVVFLHAFEKDSPKTRTRDQTRAEASVKAFFQALDSGQLKMVTTQGGEDATQRFT